MVIKTVRKDKLFTLESVMAIPGYIWNELQSRNGGAYLYKITFAWVNPLLAQTFEVGRHKLLIWILRQDNINLGHTFCWKPIQGHREGSFCSVPACSGLASKSFTDIRAYFFRIPACIEDQLRHPALRPEQLLDSWTFLSVGRCWIRWTTAYYSF